MIRLIEITNNSSIVWNCNCKIIISFTVNTIILCQFNCVMNTQGLSIGFPLGLGRLSGHFRYPAGYRILKLSGYRISGWFLLPDIWIFAGYRALARYPAGYRILKLSGYMISGWFLMPHSANEGALTFV